MKLTANFETWHNLEEQVANKLEKERKSHIFSQQSQRVFSFRSGYSLLLISLNIYIKRDEYL